MRAACWVSLVFVSIAAQADGRSLHVECAPVDGDAPFTAKVSGGLSLWTNASGSISVDGSLRIELYGKDGIVRADSGRVAGSYTNDDGADFAHVGMVRYDGEHENDIQTLFLDFKEENASYVEWENRFYRMTCAAS